MVLHESRVTAVMGPVATGKSVLLSALAGDLHPDVVRHGEWARHGTPLPTRGGVEGTVWLPQLKKRPARRNLSETIERLSQDCDALLLDEPDFGLNDQELAELQEAILARRGKCSMAVVTHSMDLARACADDVLLLCASEVVACGPAKEFFDNPPNALSKEWLQTGNCWPKRPPPPLPKGFNWILPGQLAGMAQPGLMGDLEEELEAIATAGVSLLVTLTEKPFPRTKLSAFGIDSRHFPILDMGVPGVSNTIRLCRSIDRCIEGGGAAALHCRAGLGRTGMMLACYLIYKGTPPEEAIEQVRQHNSNYIQSPPQMEFVRNFSG